MWSKTQSGKLNLAKHCARRQESGKAETDKLCASDFTRAWLGSEGSVSAAAAHLSQWGSFQLSPCQPGVTFLPQGTVVRGDPGSSSARHGKHTLELGSVASLSKSSDSAHPPGLL